MRPIALSLALIVMLVGCSQEERQKESTKEQTAPKEDLSKKAKSAEGLTCSDEGEKIVCKLHTKRVNYKREVSFEWESPNERDDRKREMSLSANYANIFDARLKKGRAKGLWEVEVEIDDKEYKTSFRID